MDDDKVIYKDCNFYNMFDNKMKDIAIGERQSRQMDQKAKEAAKKKLMENPHSAQGRQQLALPSSEPSTSSSSGRRRPSEARDVKQQMNDLLEGMIASSGGGEKGQEQLKKLLKGGSSGKKFAWKSQLEQLLTYEETTKELILTGEFHQAYGILDGLNRYSISIREARFLLQFCGILMISGRDREAGCTFGSLVDLIRSDFTNNSKEILIIAEKFGERQDHLAASLLCLVAEELSDHAAATQLSAAYTLKCMVVLRESAGKLVEQSGKAKQFVRRYVVPPCKRMHAVVIAVQETKDMVVHAFRMLQNMSFHALETIQLSAGDFHGRIETLREGIQFMRGVYGEDAVLRMKLYGTFYHNLGSAHLHLSQVQDAHTSFRKAMSVFEQAGDFDDEEEKQDHKKKTGEMQRLCAAAFF